MKRKYHHYKTWEDYRNGLYLVREVDKNMINKSFDLLNNTQKFSKVCLELIKMWPISTIENLTNTNQNRRAWLGQASCCFNHGANEYETKLAWSKIDTLKQYDANKVAELYIKVFEENYERQNNQTHLNLGE